MVDDKKARQTAEDMKGTVRDEAQRAGQTIREESKAVADQAATLGREHAEQRFDQGKGALEDQVDTIHSAVDGAARRLREENSPLASYADELSGQLARFSSGIENSSLDDVAVKTRQLARENPGLFVLGSVVAGIAAGRFFKASSSRDHDDDDDYRSGREAAMARYSGGSGYSSDYRSPAAPGAVPARPGASGVMSGAPGRVPMDSAPATDTTSLGTTSTDGDSSTTGTSSNPASTGTSPTSATVTTAGAGTDTGDK